MSKPINPDDYELCDKYDLSKMTVVPKDRYALEKVGQERDTS